MATKKRKPASAATHHAKRDAAVATAPLGDDVEAYHGTLAEGDRAICLRLSREITAGLPGANHKVWHGSPVWFLDGNPIVGYGKLKGCVRLLFWSGQSFDEPALAPEGSFKAAEARYLAVDDVDAAAVRRWLRKATAIQWDYKNIVKRKGRLDRLV
ncbi:MAG: DUF1801 domain-containing protein [Deltaproteobacteria bacterium]|nr:DUF1801 domain-containing protein [Deltaproteobacteria bacterium]